MNQESQLYDEMYIYLHFTDKLHQEILNEPDVHFKIVNLHKDKPFVQIGNHLFQGIYEDTIGTNLFLREVNQPTNDVYERETAINLNYFTKTAKHINLKSFEIPEELTQTHPTDMVKLDLRQDYKTVLQDFKENKIDLERLIFVETQNTSVEVPVAPTEMDLDLTDEQDVQIKDIREIQSPIPQNPPPQEHKYTNISESTRIINNILKIPTKCDKILDNLPPTMTNLIKSDKNTSNITILKQLYLQNLTFKDLKIPLEESNLKFHINITNSINEGQILTSNFVDSGLTPEEKCALISMNNIHNLSAPLQLTILKEQLKREKTKLSSMSFDELHRVDEYGRTPKDRYKILKNFAKGIWYKMFVCLSKEM